MREEQVIALAKDRLATLFAEEGVKDLRLEEIKRKSKGGWSVTLSFFRPASIQPNITGALAHILTPEWQRAWKVVEVNGDGEVIAIVNG
jgi:hypothetical protein